MEVEVEVEVADGSDFFKVRRGPCLTCDALLIQCLTLLLGGYVIIYHMNGL